MPLDTGHRSGCSGPTLASRLLRDGDRIFFQILPPEVPAGSGGPLGHWSSLSLLLQKVFYPCSTKFSRQVLAVGKFQDSAFNICMEKSLVTGPDNYITHCDPLNFHPSYNVSRPSICD